jgi:hypothetical protein
MQWRCARCRFGRPGRPVFGGIRAYACAPASFEEKLRRVSITIIARPEHRQQRTTFVGNTTVNRADPIASHQRKWLPSPVLARYRQMMMMSNNIDCIEPGMVRAVERRGPGARLDGPARLACSLIDTD